MQEQVTSDAVRGAGWAFASSVSVRVLQVVTTLALAKLLVPADFGLFALASIVTNAMAMLPDIGFAQALIYEQGDVKRSANTAFILSVLLGLTLAAGLFLLAPAMARGFGVPGLTGPLRVMSATLVVTGATAVPLSLMDKKLRFKRRAVPELLGAGTYAAVSIALAAAGLGVWSMVIGWTAMTAVYAVAVWLVSGWRPALEFWPDKSRVIVNYGKHLVVASLAAFIFLQVDKAAIGKWVGVTALGFYSISFTVCNLPATNITGVLNRVMFPTYSRMGGPAEIRECTLELC
ncbi:MAG: oligosaccharide flippase family protein, partial [Armatimonadota bacterium]